MDDQIAVHGAAVARVERMTTIPMLALALAYLAALIIGALPSVLPEWHRLAMFAEDVIIAVFAEEFLVRIALAQRRLAYLRAHWLDVVIIVVPFLRPFRLLRLLRLLPMLLRAVGGLRQILGPYRGSYVLPTSLLAIITSAGLVTIFESGGDGAIDEFADGLWWAIVTITTVGYGDLTPVTTEGRAVAVFLMLIGITLFGVLTASIAAYFVDTTTGDERDLTLHALTEKIDGLESRIREQQELLRALLNRADDEAGRR